MIRRLLTASILFSLAALSMGARVSAQGLHLPMAVRSRLANGVRLVILEYHRAPTLTVRAVFDGGEKLDPPDKTGTTSLMASLLRRGTETRTAPQIAEAIDFLGGSLDAASSDERCTLSLDVLAKDTDAGLDLLADLARHPTFPAEELERERSLQIASLKTIGEDPARVADYMLTKTVYGGHPYGRETTAASLQAITRDDITAAYRAALSPDRLIIVAVGDFHAAEMAERLRTRFADWTPTSPRPPAAPPVRATPLARVLVDKPDATQTQARFARIGIPRTSPEFIPAEIANTILGGGFTSRLVDEVRVNRSLTYGIGSVFRAQRAGGLFEISTFTKIETTVALLDTVKSVLAKAARGGLTESEYRKAQGYMAGQFAAHVQTPEALAGELADIAFYGLPDDYLQTYLARLRATPLAQVNRVAARYFGPEALSIILVGPASGISRQLATEGQFDVHPVEQVGK